jgi:anthranilate synthase component 1
VYAAADVPDAYAVARERLHALRRRLRQSPAIPFQTATSVTEAVSETGEQAFLAAVRRAKDYIAAGDVMQVVLSQRLRMPFTASPLSLYRALRSLNPSPYMFYYDFGDFHVVGASPEILVRKEGDTVTLRPIAGTRPRGATRDADEKLAHEMTEDPKEIAEHVMLLDLGRNDVGRVAAIGTVRVTEQFEVERYSHVMHMVSNVEGTLAPGRTSFDVLGASFPAGTVSGAPKVRAMEIIDELEPFRRGVYAGAVGYISFQDDMDLAIAIRTAVLTFGAFYVQAGAGIVHVSVPECEWRETGSKARAVLRAAEMVQAGLDADDRP